MRSFTPKFTDFGTLVLLCLFAAAGGCNGGDVSETKPASGRGGEASALPGKSTGGLVQSGQMQTGSIASVPDARAAAGTGDALKAGDAAPNFRVTDLSGAPVNLENFRGKTVLLNFWATWCVPCVTEMPALERLSKSFPKDQFEVVAVSVDSPEQNDDVKKFIQQNGISFKILRDPDLAIPPTYGITGFPESFFIDREGKFLSYVDPVEKSTGVRVVGDRPWDSPAMVDAVRALLGKKTP